MASYSNFVIIFVAYNSNMKPAFDALRSITPHLNLSKLTTVLSKLIKAVLVVKTRHYVIVYIEVKCAREERQVSKINLNIL
jgi:hypothetical protein